jgi:hypothetical protein
MARLWCPLAGGSVSIVPAVLAARMSGTLDQAAVLAFEPEGSIAAAAERALAAQHPPRAVHGRAGKHHTLRQRTSRSGFVLPRKVRERPRARFRLALARPRTSGTRFHPASAGPRTSTATFQVGTGMSVDHRGHSDAQRACSRRRQSQTTIEARMPNGGSVWAQAEIAVGFTPGRLVVAHDAPVSGEIPFAIGAPSFIRIPVPGSGGLAIELSPRGWVPKTGSTSTLFIQDLTGKRHLRLDFGFNVKTGTINYHWNQSKTFNLFKIADHTQVGALGSAVYKSARYFKYAGRMLGVVGVAIDVYSVVTSTRPLRQATKVISGWGGAWLGCKLVGAGGAWVGTAVTPAFGTAIGGVTGCIAGAFIGYEGASRSAGRLYDWGEAQFNAVPEVAAP